MNIKELLAEAEKRRPVLPPNGYVLDPFSTITDAIRNIKAQYVPPYVAPIIYHVPYVASEPIAEQDAPAPVEEPVEVVDTEKVDSPVACTACESGECLTHGARTEDVVVEDSPIAQEEISTQELDEPNPVVEESAGKENPEPVDTSSTGTAQSTDISVDGEN